MNYAQDFGHSQGALELQRDFVYGLWFEHGVSLTIAALIILVVIVAAWDKFKWWGPQLRYSIRTWRMTPKQYEEWQREVIASDLVDLFDNRVKSGVLSRAKAHQWLQAIGHLGYWDLVPGRAKHKPSILDRLVKKEELKAKHKSDGNTFGSTLRLSAKQSRENNGE